MTRVLITAFEPFDRWSENSSWLALVELTRSLPESPKKFMPPLPFSW